MFTLLKGVWHGGRDFPPPGRDRFVSAGHGTAVRWAGGFRRGGTAAGPVTLHRHALARVHLRRTDDLAHSIVHGNDRDAHRLRQCRLDRLFTGHRRGDRREPGHDGDWLGRRRPGAEGQPGLLHLAADWRGCLPPTAGPWAVAPYGARAGRIRHAVPRSEEHTSELQSRENLVCRLLLEKKKELV